MKAVRKIGALTAILFGMTCWAGDSEPFRLDTKDLMVKTGEEVSLSYNSAWVGDNPSSEVVISADGTEIKRTTGEGEFTWSPVTAGKHTLTYTTYINGVAQDEVYTATVFKDWKYTVADGKATIVDTTQKSGSVTIPSEIDGLPVVGFDTTVFANCTNLTSITIPDSVDSVNGFENRLLYQLVQNAWALQGIESNNEVLTYKSNDIGDSASTYMAVVIEGPLEFSFNWKVSSESGYDKLKWYLNGTQNSEISGTGNDWQTVTCSIPAGEHVVKWEYSKDGSVDSGEDCGWVRLPHFEVSSVVSCFNGCMNLSQVAMPGNLVTRMSEIFPDSYDKLTSVTLTGDVTEIPQDAFAGCESLKSFVIPDSVYSIGFNAFANCTGLTKVSMPFPLKAQVESGNVFVGCSDALEIVYRTAEIKNVVAKQRFPWNGKVDISFDIEGNALAGFLPNNLPSLVVTAEDRKTGEKYIASNASLSGDIDLTTGAHKIVWDLRSNGYEFRSDDIVISAACVLIEEGLISKYLFNDDLYDSSSNNYDLSGQEGCFIADRKGVDNGAYSFNGVNQSITSTDCRLETEFTFAFWCKTSVSMSENGSGDNLGSWSGNYILFPRNSQSDAGFGVKVGMDGISVMGHGDMYLQEQLGYSANIGTGWNHIAVSVSSDGTIGIYLNGVCVKTGTKPSSRKSVFVPEVGGGAYGYYTGCIDDLLVFDKELDADTIALIYSDYVFANDGDYYIYEGESSSILVDTYTEPLFEMGVDKLSYNSSWVGGDSSAEVVISADGTEIRRTTGEGEFVWSPTNAGKHTLTYTTFINGVVQEEVYTATVFTDWRYTVEDGKATIVDTTQKSGSVSIPSEIDGLPVVGFMDRLFDGCTDLTQVVIPGNLVAKMSEMFPGSYDKLTSITLTGDVIEIPLDAFAGCVALELFTISDSVTTVGANAFKNCSLLTEIVIPDSVYSIGFNAFANCTGLKKVSMPFSLKAQVESGNLFVGCSEDLEIVYRSAEITDVVAKQRFPWNGKVDITYSVTRNIAAGLPDWKKPVVSVSALDRTTGLNYLAQASSLSGDLGTEEGTHHIVWNFNAQDLQVKSDDMVFTVAYDIPLYYCIIDLS